MSFQPAKRKSLSDRFGGLSSPSVSQFKDNRELVKSLKSNSQHGEHRQNDVHIGNKFNKQDPRTGNLTVHLKINQVNRQKKDNSYVNRPCQPLRVEYRDKPSNLSKQLTRYGSEVGKENTGMGRQISVKETFVSGRSKNMYNTSPKYGNNTLTSPTYGNQTSQLYNRTNSNYSSNFSQRDSLLGPYPQANAQQGNSSRSSSPQFNKNTLQSLTNFDTDTNDHGGSKEEIFDQWRRRSDSDTRDLNNTSLTSCSDQFDHHFSGQSAINPHFSNRSPGFYRNIDNHKQIGHIQNLQHKSPDFSRNENNSTESGDLRYSGYSGNFHNSDQPGNMHGTHVNKSPVFSRSQFPSKEYTSQGNSQLEQHNNKILQNTSNKSPGFCQMSTHVDYAHSSMPCATVDQNPGYSCEGVVNNRQTQYRNRSPGFANQSQREDNLTGGLYQSQNKSAGSVGNKQYNDDYYSNLYNQNFSLKEVKFGHVTPQTQAPCQMPADNSQSFDDQPYSPNQLISAQVSRNTTPQNGHDMSPTFSSDSEMSMDSNQLSSGSASSQQSQGTKPAGFYIDLSKEISEVEALKKKFIDQCESMVSNDEDKKTVEMVKKSLLTVNFNDKKLDKSSNSKTNSKKPAEVQRSLVNDVPPKLVIDESRKDTNSIQGSLAGSPSSATDSCEEMKFEGRTLLKGGVKPRHIPKMLIDKPGLGPPSDRRSVYLTARNLLELPLPKWAAEVLGKSVLECDISDGHNKEKTPVKTSGKSPLCKNGQEKDTAISNKLEERLTEIFNFKDEEKAVVVDCASKKAGNNCTVNKKLPSSENKQTHTASVKRTNETITNNSTNDKSIKTTKKLKVDNKSKAESTLGGNVMQKKESKKEANIQAVLDKNPKPKLCNGSSKSANQDTKRSTSRDRSRSRQSRSRDDSRSRNRSRSRERHSWKDKKPLDSQYRRLPEPSYRSRSREGRHRSPIKARNKASFNKFNVGDIMASITMASHQDKDSRLKHEDIFDSNRHLFRGNEDDFNFIDPR